MYGVDFTKKRRIVIKVGSSTITHEATGNIDYTKLERLVRQLCDLRAQGKDVCLVSSGAIAVGRYAIGLKDRPQDLATKQACASIGQAFLMSVYQKLFSEYNQRAGQILMTKKTMTDPESRENARNTFEQLFELGVIPVVNENDTVATEEIEFGDNDTLSAIVSTLIGADMLILLTDIDGFYTDDPRKNKHAKRISVVEKIDDSLKDMAKGTVTRYGTGGMYTKIAAAQIASHAGADTAILESSDMEIIYNLLNGEDVGTIFLSDTSSEFDIIDFIKNKKYLEK